MAEYRKSKKSNQTSVNEYANLSNIAHLLQSNKVNHKDVIDAIIIGYNIPGAISFVESPRDITVSNNVYLSKAKKQGDIILKLPEYSRHHKMNVVYLKAYLTVTKDAYDNVPALHKFKRITNLEKE